ncbi:MAG: sedoheptulose 7-phosphate cyclase [Kofleriaceae bacterium]
MTAVTVPNEWVMETHLPVRFTIKNSPGLLTKQNRDLLEFGSQGPTARRFVVIDRHICQFYLPQVIEYFRAHGVEAHILAINATENDKNLESLLEILRELEKFGILRRDEPLIAIGGGVLLDIAGMAAGMYRRGIPYIRVPTTLVGLVDASVGAKTGINFENRRNRLGSYYPPIAAYLDKAFLRTLEPVEISSGLGEILKMAVVKDARLFSLLEESGPSLVENKFEHSEHADEIINRAVIGMKDELQDNLWEKNLERFVDFGHSFSPIIEMRSINEKDQVPLTHGQAVALDVLFSCVLSTARNLMPQAELMRVARVAKSLGLPTNHALFNVPLIILEALKDTMKHRNGAQNLPFPVKIGESVFVNDLSYEEIQKAVPILKSIRSDLLAGAA